MSSEDQPTKRRVAGRLWLIGVVVAGVLGLTWIVVNKGPASALRWVVRTVDPALRLQTGRTFYQDGEWVLREVRLNFRGQKEPVLNVKEVRLGLGPHWHKGSIGSMVLVEPQLRAEAEVVAHFTGGEGGGGWSIPWEVGRLEIQRGHLWLEEYGDPRMDVSVNVDAAWERLGPAAPAEMQRVRLSGLYVAVHETNGVRPFFGAGEAAAEVSWGGLESGRIASLRVAEGWMVAGDALVAMTSGGDASPGGMVLEAVDLVDLHVRSGEFAKGMPELSLRVNAALRDVGLGEAAEELAEKVHQVEFADLEIFSPLDPLRTAATVRSIFVKFTLGGLGRKEVQELILLSPTLYIGPALFDYMQMSSGDAAAVPEEVTAAEGWRVDRLQINFGKAVIAAGGRPKVGLPLAFQAQAQNVSLSSLAGLDLDLELTIPAEDYEFPDYDMDFKKVRGEFLLNYPPQKKSNNVVNVVEADRARWRNFRARNLWISMTFDAEGINGLFGGQAYRGYLNGGFTFLFQPESPWTGWLAATELDMDPLTQDAAPQNLVMSGMANAALEVNGRAAEVDRVRGRMETLTKGRLVVNKLNEMLAALPPEWSSIKREVSRVGLEALRDFDYTEGVSDFWFVGRRGMLRFQMKGPSGSRNLEVAFHGEGQRDGAWSERRSGR
jgi:hypothetical protein